MFFYYDHFKFRITVLITFNFWKEIKCSLNFQLRYKVGSKGTLKWGVLLYILVHSTSFHNHVKFLNFVKQLNFIFN